MFCTFRVDFSAVYFSAPCSSLHSLYLAARAFCFMLHHMSRHRAACQKPLEFAMIWVMYSALFLCFHLRAAHFLFPGYTNHSISIPHQAVTGSWGSSGDGQSLHAPFSNMHLAFQHAECETACFPSFFELLIISYVYPNAKFPFTIHTFFDNEFSSRRSIATETQLLPAKGVSLHDKLSYHDNHISQRSSCTEIPAAWWGL